MQNLGQVYTQFNSVEPLMLANDSANVYWIDPNQVSPGGGIGQVSKSGGSAGFLVQKVLATGGMDALIADQSGIYWSESGAGQIYTPIVASTGAFPMFDAIKAFDSGSGTRTYTVSGDCSGSGSVTTAVATPSVFQSTSGYSETTTVTLSLTNCTPVSFTSSVIDYYDANYIPIGYDATASGGNYAVYTTLPAIPSSVVVGDSGTIGTNALYTSSTKTTSNGSEVVSYVIEPDTATSAIINLVTKTYNNSGVLTLTAQNRYRITMPGTQKQLSEDDQYSNGATLHMVLTFN